MLIFREDCTCLSKYSTNCGINLIQYFMKCIAESFAMNLRVPRFSIVENLLNDNGKKINSSVSMRTVSKVLKTTRSTGPNWLVLTLCFHLAVAFLHHFPNKVPANLRQTCTGNTYKRALCDLLGQASSRS